MTRLQKMPSSRNLLTAAVLTAALAPHALQAHEALCPLGNATLRGTYMSHGSGSVVGLGSVAAVGLLMYDGKGHVVNPFTASVNGTIVHDKTIGTYTVNSDCTGTSVTSTGNNYTFVVAPDGSNVFWLRADTGFIDSGSAVRLRRFEEDVE